MGRGPSEMLTPGDPLMLEAIECLKRYQTAQAQSMPLTESACRLGPSPTRRTWPSSTRRPSVAT
jgi:hypothetical protein